jgi:ribonucleotide monophosphatase NagD (HAD superfamily)
LKKLKNFSVISNSYDAFIIDLWGVMHNGIRLNSGAIEVVENLSKNRKRIVFLTNAPRPNKSVIKFLKKLNMDEKYFNNIFTSGEIARDSLKTKKY